MRRRKGRSSKKAEAAFAALLISIVIAVVAGIVKMISASRKKGKIVSTASEKSTDEHDIRSIEPS